ncbi:inactive carboxylesterase 4 [Hyaloscypha variabilis F]|uniref:Carboxylic ester hydrolase n=1 Tax=Hyaloscypha variabilis (strain UAMH 11265 / GT02V1 / F) TaxID=1149755 RepID=A0A2J6QW53_HYAVF|nr:inactive carboxylesterase 4 [Hyaloscypha variabilis F]
MGLQHIIKIASSLLYFATTANGQGTGLAVDLGYGLYVGVNNGTTGLTVWKGIRYAAPPVATLRWQAPQTPPTNRTIISADTFGPYCPQAFSSFPGAPFYVGNEDCLFLNVYAPTGASNLPVMVVIHGGGYGEGDGTQDMSGFINANDNALIVVTIQYRLGAFGFASSSEIKSRGVLNAGLMDQVFALEWLQKNIAQFGGDPDRVTIAGESAGGGSVMLHAIAQDGSLGTTLFKNLISASPYLPTQPNYSDPIPTQHYYDFAKSAGCPSSGEVFDCLVAKDSLTLQYASNLVSTNAPTPHGNWAFIPVTDGTYVTGLPSVLLNQRRVNGLRLLAGNNANEGALVVPTNIVTQNDLVTWIKGNFPNLSAANITQLLAAYPSSSNPVNPSDPKYETNGLGPGTAVNVSQVGTGQQQRANDIYAESAAVCPSYWLATAFTGPNVTAYHYQYSVPFAVHGADVSAYYGPATDNQSPDFVTAFRKIYGNFVTTDNPSISSTIANGASSTNPNASNPASKWPVWADNKPMQLNLNETGGAAYSTVSPQGVPITQFREPGLLNDFTVADAYAWEGGRGQRCEFWRALSPYVPQ